MNETTKVAMEIDSVRVESSLWIGNKRYRAFLSGWYFSWTEIDKRNREKKTSTTFIIVLNAPVFQKCGPGRQLTKF